MTCPELERLRAENAALRDALASRDREIAHLRAVAGVSDVLLREDEHTTTVVARIAALGYASDKHLAWRCGSAAQAAWRRRNGTQPPKANTSKTRGGGNHCHARYPIAWRDELDRIIHATAGNAPSQGTLDLNGE